MIRKLKKWFRNWLADDDETSDSNRPVLRRRSNANAVNLAISNPEPSIGVEPIKLFVYPANGGFVVETRIYDDKRDRNNSSLYLITDHEKMGEEISKIITMASLTR